MQLQKQIPNISLHVSKHIIYGRYCRYILIKCIYKCIIIGTKNKWLPRTVCGKFKWTIIYPPEKILPLLHSAISPPDSYLKLEIKEICLLYTVWQNLNTKFEIPSTHTHLPSNTIFKFNNTTMQYYQNINMNSCKIYINVVRNNNDKQNIPVFSTIISHTIITPISQANSKWAILRHRH